MSLLVNMVRTWKLVNSLTTDKSLTLIKIAVSDSSLKLDNKIRDFMQFHCRLFSLWVCISGSEYQPTTSQLRHKLSNNSLQHTPGRAHCLACTQDTQSNS